MNRMVWGKRSIDEPYNIEELFFMDSPMRVFWQNSFGQKSLDSLYAIALG